MKKYELTSEAKVVFGKNLYRIRALASFGDVNEGELGGWIEKEYNLSQDGEAWVYGNAQVFGNAWVCGNAHVCDNAQVSGNARVSGNACVFGNAWVCGNAHVCGNARVSGNAWVERSTHLLTIGAIGSRNDFTTFARNKNKQIMVACGCFHGTIDEFAAKVKATHGDSKHAKAYMAAIELAKIQIEDAECRMNNSPKCPYCGARMRLHKTGASIRIWYECECGSQSPHISPRWGIDSEESWQEATLKAALHRMPKEDKP